MEMKKYILPILLLYAGTSLAQTLPVTISATPTTGVAPADVVLSWTSPLGSQCTAAGGWTGAKADNGTQTITAVTISTNYTLNCTAPNASAVLTWVPPTQNVDNTPLTNLASYKILKANSVAELATVTPIVVLAPASTYTINGITAGSFVFGVKATTSAGVDSDMSNTIGKIITLGTGTASIAVTINNKPKPPVLSTVAQLAYSVTADWNTFKFARSKQIGTVPLGTVCDAAKALPEDGWYAIPITAVKYTGTSRPAYVVGKCAII
jgi:hypothetical protein